MGAQTAVLDLVQLAAIVFEAAASAVLPGEGADVKLAQNRVVGFVRPKPDRIASVAKLRRPGFRASGSRLP